MYVVATLGIYHLNWNSRLPITFDAQRSTHFGINKLCEIPFIQKTPYLVFFCILQFSKWERQMIRLMTKPTKCPLRPAKTQISLGIRPVWSKSSLSAWMNIASYANHWAHFEDSDQTGRMPRLTSVFAGRAYNFVGFVMRRLKYFLKERFMKKLSIWKWDCDCFIWVFFLLQREGQKIWHIWAMVLSLCHR